ncbi:MAG: tRNA (N6-threonylcarbamoyladenosine(37)-N6)-methyltransferase TrmO [Prevotella bivia]|uniref:tRNA (N6-threonylcarbamoyladenosine(37)-N6)-methyltransferase TrmO n=1 Tax=Prevotella bivia TaxID=28125 RepID=UPI00050FFC62|nr:tRNA (N6-threonylcarbamoyladenosine(37)-N6)-methyltransferase TrmO [Prevotella bivia]KGF38127.1 methyltransferase [Prevotella bivia DNF00650]KXU58342.1 methyltransferase, YaeB family [Prevotella bivia]MDU2113944.1 tRNA (N6-threonylcarbamoyladenosine(37)-N6)-methyltransferase TrmO [Prevotella bivia]
MKEIEPIAVFHSPLTSKFGIPRQSGIAENLVGTIELLPPYNREEAIRGIEKFDYLWLIWGFSANKDQSKDNTEGIKLMVRPPRLGGNERLGVFATRSPFRPNGLGLSSVKIVKIDNNKIDVAGADLMDGTPIYDIKPYISYVDSHSKALGGFTDEHEWKVLTVKIGEKWGAYFDKNKLAALKELLAQDPRPQYHNDENRVYGMPYDGKDVRFKVVGDVLTVCNIEKL